MSTFQPPPTYAEVVLADPAGKQPPRFNPIWLKWFVDIARGLNAGGAGSGSVSEFTFIDANGIVGSVANGTTTPQLTLALGAITPTSIITTGAITAGTALAAGTSVTAGTSLIATTHLYPSTAAGAVQTGTSLFAGTGAPNNTNGADGDYYFRSDAGGATHIYFKAVGTWAAIL